MIIQTGSASGKQEVPSDKLEVLPDKRGGVPPTNRKRISQTRSAHDKWEVPWTIGKCNQQAGSASSKQEVPPTNRKCHPQEMQIFGNVGNLDLDGNAGRTGNTGVLMSLCSSTSGHQAATSSFSCWLSTLVSPGFGKKKNLNKKQTKQKNPSESSECCSYKRERYLFCS